MDAEGVKKNRSPGEDKLDKVEGENFLVNYRFDLNTCIELPHEKSINQIRFQPLSGDGQLRCVTVGNDKIFKIWQLTAVDELNSKSTMWQCSKVGFYRDMPCQALAFSSDGSLIAVSFGPIVTTWTPDTCEIKCSLVHPSSRERIDTICFGIANHCHLFVAASCDYISAWNLLSLHMVWTVPVGVKLLISNPLISNMAAFTIDQKLHIFSLSSPEPLFSMELEEEVTAATLVPRKGNSDSNSDWYRSAYLYFIDSNGELYSLDADEEINEDVNVFESENARSLFASTIPENQAHKPQSVKPVKHTSDIAFRNRQLKQLLNSPVHTMVPMKLMCESLLRSVLKEIR